LRKKLWYIQCQAGLGSPYLYPGYTNFFSCSSDWNSSEDGVTFTYIAPLLSFHWPSNQDSKLPPTSYYDSEGLRVTLNVPVIPTKLFWKESSVFYADITTLLAALHIAHSNLSSFSFYFDDHTAASTKALPKQQALLCLLKETHRTQGLISTIRCQLRGLALAPGPVQDAWQRMGMWELDLWRVSPTLSPNNGHSTMFELFEGSETKPTS
jgi:hypothetical protein